MLMPNPLRRLHAVRHLAHRARSPISFPSRLLPQRCAGCGQTARPCETSRAVVCPRAV